MVSDSVSMLTNNLTTSDGPQYALLVADTAPDLPDEEPEWVKEDEDDDMLVEQYEEDLALEQEMIETIVSCVPTECLE